MSDLLLIVKKPTAAQPEPDLEMRVKPKTAAAPAEATTASPATQPAAKDYDDSDAGMNADAIAVPTCPKCMKSGGVVPIKCHPSMAKDWEDGDGDEDEPDAPAEGPADDDDDDDADEDGDGFCCLTCKYVFPGDQETPQEQPPRPAGTEKAAEPAAATDGK